MLKFLWLCNHRTILHIHLTVWLQCWSTVYQWESPFAVLQPELWHVNANLIGHNDHQVVLFYSLPGISQPCYIFYFVHMCMALPLWLCQISSFIMGAVLLHWTVTQSSHTYICGFWVPFMYKHVLVRICFCSLQHAVACYRLGLVYLVQQGQRTTQDLTYVTVDHSQRRPINVPNENLDVQYTGVKFDTEAPAV